MSIIDRFLAALAPYECLACSAEGRLLCVSCVQNLPSAPELCFRCQKSSEDGRTCTDCRASSSLYRVRAGTIYSDISKELVLRLKFSGARQGVLDMAARLLPLLEKNAPRTVIVPVPTATSRIRRRSYDQAGLLARALSRQTRLPYRHHLVRSGRTRQVGASRRLRLNQLEGAFRARRTSDLANKHIVLVDDVLTTGATLESAAKALSVHGPNRISAVVFARS